MVEIWLRDYSLKYSSKPPSLSSIASIKDIYERPQRISISTNEDTHLLDFLNQIETPNLNVNDITKIEPTVTDKSIPSSIQLHNKVKSIQEINKKLDNSRIPPLVQQENSHINQPEKVISIDKTGLPLHSSKGKLTTQLMNSNTAVKSSILQILEHQTGTTSIVKLKQQEKKAIHQMNNKKIFQRGGKMYIIDPLQNKLKKQSLLKPQVSLLKARVPVSLLKPESKSSIVPGDHDYIKLKNCNEIIVKKAHSHNFSQDLELKFESIKFVTFRHAIDFLLRKLPLVSQMANDLQFKMCYPFIVSSLMEYQKLGQIKQFIHEWLRAKYIKKCFRQHNIFKDNAVWTTKEIFVYARKHAFLPVINYSYVLDNQFERNQAVSNLSKLIINEIKNENYSMQTLSLCHKVYDFIYSLDSKCEKTSNKIIDVDNIICHDISKIKLETNQLDPPIGKLYMGIHENLETESLVVSSLTQDIGIRLEHESIGNSEYYFDDNTVFLFVVLIKL